MLKLNNIKDIPENMGPFVVTVGNFDGLHRGHQELLEKLSLKSYQYQAPSALVTFSPHPAEVLGFSKKLSKISSLGAMSCVSSRWGLDVLLVQKFSRKLAGYSAEQFLDEFLVGPFQLKCLVIGYDFSFGKNRSGNHEFLKAKSKELGFELVVVPALEDAGAPISSTRVRALLEAGDVKYANSLLGYSYFIDGKVVQGEGRGRGLGFPTANVKTSIPCILENGVYFTRLTVDGDVFESVTNIGVKPTFHESYSKQVEVHIIDHKIDLYGKNVQLEFIDRLRAEQRFSSAEELIKQIQVDVDQARVFFEERNDQVGGNSNKELFSSISRVK